MFVKSLYVMFNWFICVFYIKQRVITYRNLKFNAYNMALKDILSLLNVKN